MDLAAFSCIHATHEVLHTPQVVIMLLMHGHR